VINPMLVEDPVTCSLSFSASSELQSLHSHIAIYCNNIVGTVPSLRQFATVIVSQTLLRN